jgi:DNA polymerase I-like protein with 3'-5' exonuclease and polymerase domains
MEVVVISLDTETTGVDLYHGARPFFVTTCNGAGEQQFWEWDVDPLTRLPVVPPEDMEEINSLVTGAPELVLQNSKFDCAALATLGLPSGDWPWGKTQDTLIASHVLASNRPHDLTSLAIQYVGWDIKPFEDTLEVAVQKCRRWCRSHLPEWRLAKKDLPEMPSAGDKTWKYDTWLPRALVRHLWQSSEAGKFWAIGRLGAGKREGGITRKIFSCSQLPGWEYALPEASDKPHPWWTVLRDYANADSAATVEIWKEQVKELHRRGLWEIYLARRQVMGIAHRMERRGVTVSKRRLVKLSKEYVQEAAHSAEVCQGIAALYEHECQRCALEKEKAEAGKRQKLLPGICPVCNGTGRAPYNLELPKGGVNDSLRIFIFDVLKLPPITNKRAKTDRPTLNAGAVEYYLQTLPTNSMGHLFVSKLVEKRRRDTAVSYMKGYERFWLPYKPTGGRNGAPKPVPGWYVLHPSLNPTGTDTLRWSSSHPNEQNISKKEGFNLRYCFGPAPGREWWSLDAKNIELRIPAYESGEKDFIDLFERPDDPPYFGSNHLLIAHLLHKEAFEECVNPGPHPLTGKPGFVDGRIFKKRYASTLYQRTKNGNFALLYGAVDRADGQGTADRTYGIPGAQSKIKARFTRMEALNQKWIAFARKHGYVETMPSRAINPSRGYPIMCSRTEYGDIKPTVPLNYHVQSTAMEWMQQAMIRCDAKLEEWRKDGFDGHMILQVHDELVFDFPQDRSVGKGPDGKEVVTYGNLWRVREIQRLMEQGGGDIGVPTPVSCEYHAVSWAEGISL